MTTNAADALERLEQKWRDWSRMDFVRQGAAQLSFRQCADELATIRASLPDRQREAVAWQCRSAWGDGFTEWQECSEEDYEQMAPLLMDCRGEALATQFRALYTHPAPAAVTDAMVERALDAYYCHGISWKEAAELCGDTREEMRAALAAALQIGGE